MIACRCHTGLSATVLLLALFLILPSFLTARGVDDRYIIVKGMQSLADFTQYATSLYVDAGVNESGKRVGYFKATDAGKSNEDGVRTNLDMAMVCAFLYDWLDDGDPQYSIKLPQGVAKEDLQRMALRALRYGYSTHHTVRQKRCTDGKYWGTYLDEQRQWHHQWESSLWTLSLAFAAEYLSAVTDDEDELQMEKVIVSEADYQLSRPVPHGFRGDTKAEEKRWADKGLSWQTRLWIDDMYMITILQSQAYRATGNRKYIDRTARSMAVYLDELQRPNGLFYHAPDVPFLWGRGNGWMAAGMAELLKVLPKDNPDRPRILQGYLDMMKSLKQYQAENGMWNQLIDAPDCWNETSGTAMFTYAMITGVKQGWLKAREYAPAVRKAWLSLVSYINENGDVTEVCSGTNKRNNRQYYYDRPKKTGDYHGQAPVLWCAFALMENK